MFLPSSRCHGVVWCRPCGEHPGEVPVCSGGICEEPVSQPAEPIRPPAPPPALPAYRLLAGHRAAVFCATGGQDAHWDIASRYAALWLQLQLALHAHSAARAATFPPLQWERTLRLSNTGEAHPSFLPFLVRSPLFSFPRGSIFLTIPPLRLLKCYHPGYTSQPIVRHCRYRDSMASQSPQADSVQSFILRRGMSWTSCCTVHQQVWWTHFRCQL